MVLADKPVFRGFSDDVANDAQKRGLGATCIIYFIFRHIFAFRLTSKKVEGFCCQVPSEPRHAPATGMDFK